MRHCGDLHLAHLGAPDGNEAGFLRPVVIVTAQAVLDHDPSVVQVVPLTSTIRDYRSEVLVDPDPHNGLEVRSAAQCQHVRAIAVQRLAEPVGSVGPYIVSQVREALADLLDI